MNPRLRKATHVPRVQHSASAGLSPRRSIDTIKTKKSCFKRADGSEQGEKHHPSCRSELHDAAAKFTRRCEPVNYVVSRDCRQPSSPPEIREELKAAARVVIGRRLSGDSGEQERKRGQAQRQRAKIAAIWSSLPAEKCRNPKIVQSRRQSARLGQSKTLDHVLSNGATQFLTARKYV